jgi:ketosteroid isomerase-like protein
MEWIGLTNDIKMAIDKANKNFSEGFVKSDASITASGFADDAVVFPPDANMIQGKKAIEAFWKSVMISGVKEVTLNTAEISVSGDFAVERGTGVLKIHPGTGTPIEQNIKNVVVWRHVANSWKNMWDIWNTSP